MDRLVTMKNAHRGNRPALWLGVVLALAWCAGAGAQIADPTQPPPGLAAAAAGAAPPAPPPGPELQSILVSREPGGRRIAVISGEMVRQGGRVGGATVEQIGTDRVVLRRGKARETLRLYTKPPHTPVAPATQAEQR
ncbi:MSHA biogenesis protein MshK [Massilia sp. METH4]|uniref:MSHA biogenesis protein MshK n=1 Tax=Massilia sp. METH4 TaxID=3123041 RepID=UPI0030CBFFF7